VYPERALSDKFNLVVQVARQVQVGTEYFCFFFMATFLKFAEIFFCKLYFSIAWVTLAFIGHELCHEVIMGHHLHV